MWAPWGGGLVDEDFDQPVPRRPARHDDGERRQVDHGGASAGPLWAAAVKLGAAGLRQQPIGRRSENPAAGIEPVPVAGGGGAEGAGGAGGVAIRRWIVGKERRLGV